MEWINGLEIIGLIITAGLLFALIRELKKISKIPMMENRVKGVI